MEISPIGSPLACGLDGEWWADTVFFRVSLFFGHSCDNKTGYGETGYVWYLCREAPRGHLSAAACLSLVGGLVDGARGRAGTHGTGLAGDSGAWKIAVSGVHCC